jgi:hypothetical protein
MSFVLQQSESYSWPITIILPVDGGRREKHTFDGEFKRLPQSRINEIIKLARAMELGRIAEDEELNDQEAAQEVLVGWSGIQDFDGNEIPFTQKALAELLEIPTLASQIVKAWFESIEVGKRKN